MQLYLFCMSGPVFFGTWLYSLHSRILPNWIAIAVPPLFCLMALYWSERRTNWKPWLAVGLTIGVLMSAVMYDTDLLGKVINNKLPGDKDPSHRVRGWRESALAVEAEREEFDTNAFIIADHYGTTGLFTFYSPPHVPLPVLTLRWSIALIPTYPSINSFSGITITIAPTARAKMPVFVIRLDPYPLEHGWFWKWLRREPIAYGEIPPPLRVPPRIAGQFETVTNLGIREIKLRDGRIFQRLQVFGCYNLK